MHQSVKSEIGTMATTAGVDHFKPDRNGHVKPNGYIPLPPKDNGRLLQDLFSPQHLPDATKVS